MKRNFIVLFTLSLMLTSCAALTGVASLITCNYDIDNVSNPQIAGISLSNITSAENLGAGSIAKLALGIAAKDLPLSVTVNLAVENPNVTEAQLAGLDWDMVYKGRRLLSGQANRYVRIAPNGGKAIVPLTVQVNIFDILESNDKKNETLRFANSIINLGRENSDISIRVNPAFNIGGRIIKTGYITVSKI